MRRCLCMILALVVVGAGSALISRECLAQESPNGFIQGIKTDKNTYSLDDKITLTYAIRNDSSKTMTFTFPSSKQYDVWITRGNVEIYRRSAGMMYAQAITEIKLAPSETKTFKVDWNPKALASQEAGPGTYTAYAQLLPMRSRLPVVSCTFEIGASNAALAPVTIREAIRRANELMGRRVVISAIYRGWQPDPSDSNTKDGPPVSRSDWAICDGSGCMYVNGAVNLDPVGDVGTKVTVVGKLRKTSKGQVYLIAESTTIGR